MWTFYILFKEYVLKDDMAFDLEEVGKVFTKLPAFVMLRVPVFVIWPRLSHRWLLTLVTLLVASKETVGDGVAGGGQSAASRSSAKDIDGVASSPLLRLPLVSCLPTSLLPSFSWDWTGKTQPLLGGLARLVLSRDSSLGVIFRRGRGAGGSRDIVGQGKRLWSGYDARRESRQAVEGKNER